MTERQGSQRDMASVNIKTRRRPSVPWGTWTGESLVVGLSVLITPRVRKTKKSSKVMVYFFIYIYYFKLRAAYELFERCACKAKVLCYFCLFWYRFGNGSPHYRVSIWRYHPATGSPRVHQQSCCQSATGADVWTYETDEGTLVYWPQFFYTVLYSSILQT